METTVSISKYFNHDKNESEQNLYESMVIETIKLSGVDVSYLPADREIIDPILEESVRTRFKDIVTIEAYMPDGGRQGGEGELMAKFGYARRETMQLVMSKRRFREETFKVFGKEWHRPREGDLIFVGDLDKPYTSQINEIYEITYVSFYEGIWSFGKTFAWKLDIAAYQFGHEEFGTGTELDAVMDGYAAKDITRAINEAVTTTKETFVAFDKNNPLGNV